MGQYRYAIGRTGRSFLWIRLKEVKKMTNTDSNTKPLRLFMALMLAATLASCGGGDGGKDPILGGSGVTATGPTVTATAPTPNATAVPVNTKVVTAAFSRPMDATTLNAASFLLDCPAATPVVGGVVSYQTTGNLATLTLPAVPDLPASTECTATVTTAAKDSQGTAMASNFVWRFTTGITVDLTRPRVTLTVPATTTPGPTVGVANNTAITATFTEDMAPATISDTSFTVTCTLPCVSPAGATSYVVGSRTAVFTPVAALASGSTYTATLTIANTDLAANALAGNQAALPAASEYIWTFTTAVGDIIPPTVTNESPANLATNIALNTTVSATFSEPMAPLTITTANFTVQASGPPLGPLLGGLVSYDALTNIATFTPTVNLLPETTYTATVSNAATDLAGNALVAGLLPNPWTFTTGTGLAPGAANLRSAKTFGIMATSAITNVGNSIINGDVSLDPGTSMTGFPPGVVNGAIHINDLVSAQARADLLVAYNFSKDLPPGTTIAAGADLGALYPLGIPPGTYTSGSTMLVSTPLTLDAGGNVDAVWTFQIGSSLTTGASVSLGNGAQAKNVFWVPTEDATIGVGTIFNGNIVTGRDATCVTGSVINGRILAGAITAGTIALQGCTINVPVTP